MRKSHKYLWLFRLYTHRFKIALISFFIKYKDKLIGIGSSIFKSIKYKNIMSNSIEVLLSYRIF